jgi:hypothetical protein
MNFYVTCPWCKSQFHNSRASNCANCGGSLPIAEGNGPGEPPPPVPRMLSKQYVKAVKYTSNVYTILGIVFTIVFCWSVIFPIIGIFLWRKGLRDAKAELQPLESGMHTKGEITAINVDYSKKINGKSPKTLEFVFMANGQKWVGTVPNIFDPIELWKRPGDQIWVVYMPDNPMISSAWPPMK